jgi:Tol biopolymer transport system component
MKYTERQITFDKKGHLLNSKQVFSPDGKWIAYDTRNDGTHISQTPTIEAIHVDTGEMRELYRTKNQTAHGPGVGAAAFSPVAGKVIFIHGIRNANASRPYSFTRRTGVMIDLANLGQPIFMDARNIKAPFTAGALRGGTHAHGWSADGQFISFTYNDYVLEQLSHTNPEVKDLRMVGVMFPQHVEVPDSEDLENNNGEMFSVIISRLNEKPSPGSDEIERAFDECWIGQNGYVKPNGERQTKAIAFQGDVRDASGKIVTEVFVVDLPDDLTQARNGEPLEGTADTRPGVPKGVEQKRITFSERGIEGPRHWLQSNPEGTIIAFLAKDEAGFINAFGVSPNGGQVAQLTFHQFNIQTGFNFSPDGKYLAYGAENAVYITEVATGKSHKLTNSFSDEEAPAGPVSWSPDGEKLAYNRYIKEGNTAYLQIFVLSK